MCVKTDTEILRTFFSSFCSQFHTEVFVNTRNYLENQYTTYSNELSYYTHLVKIQIFYADFFRFVNVSILLF